MLTHSELSTIGWELSDLEHWIRAIDDGNEAAVAIANRYAAHLCDLIQVLNAVLDLDEVIVAFPSPELFRRIRC